MKHNAIQIEPHDHFKKAILRKSNSYFVYSYYKLIYVCMELYNFNLDEAIEWVDYNIVPLSPMGFTINYSDKYIDNKR